MQTATLTTTPVFKGPFVCHSPINQIHSKGIWFGDDPLAYSLPLFLLQVFLIFIFTRTIHLILKPFGQPSFVSQILGGVTLGPSLLGHNYAFMDKVFPAKERHVLDTIGFFGFMLFIFLSGVKIDPTITYRSGKRTFAIGILGYFISYAFGRMTALILNPLGSLDRDVSQIIPIVIEIQCITSFPVITHFLSELHILNSEIGRLATSSSLVGDACFTLGMIIKYFAVLCSTRSIGVSIVSFFSFALLFVFIMFVVHPTALWAIQQSPEGKPVQEIYIFGVLVTLIFCAFLGEVIGLNAVVVSFLVGLAIPDGPPLGAALVDKLDCFVSVVFIPILFIMVGLRIDIYAIQKTNNLVVIQLIIYIAFCGKF